MVKSVLFIIALSVLLLVQGQETPTTTRDEISTTPTGNPKIISTTRPTESTEFSTTDATGSSTRRLETTTPNPISSTPNTISSTHSDRSSTHSDRSSTSHRQTTNKYLGPVAGYMYDWKFMSIIGGSLLVGILAIVLVVGVIMMVKRRSYNPMN